LVIRHPDGKSEQHIDVSEVVYDVIH
jgi:hypothetical protein